MDIDVQHVLAKMRNEIAQNVQRAVMAEAQVEIYENATSNLSQRVAELEAELSKYEAADEKPAPDVARELARAEDHMQSRRGARKPAAKSQ